MSETPASPNLTAEIETAVERAVARAISALASPALPVSLATKPSRTIAVRDRDFVDYHAVCAMTGLSRTSVVRATKRDGFPAPVKHGRRVLFPRTEVEAWIAKRLSERNPAA